MFSEILVLPNKAVAGKDICDAGMIACRYPREKRKITDMFPKKINFP